MLELHYHQQGRRAEVYHRDVPEILEFLGYHLELTSAKEKGFLAEPESLETSYIQRIQEESTAALHGGHCIDRSAQPWEASRGKGTIPTGR